MIRLESYEFASLLNTFSFKLYHETRRSDKNLILSPAQLMMSLSILAMASDTSTEKELQLLLGYGDPHKLGFCVSQGIKELLHWVQKVSITQIAVEKTLIVSPQYQLRLKQAGLDYNMFFEQVDFVKGSQMYKKTINQKAQQCMGVQNFIGDGFLNSFVRVIIVNTIHYICQFESPFSEKLTQQETFVINNRNTNYKTLLVDVFMMNQIQNYKYFDDKIASFITLPLKDFRFSMDIIIPKIRFEEYESLLNYTAYVQYILQSKQTKIHLQLPKFKIQPDATLTFKDILSSMGLSNLFSNQKCDLSKLEKTKSGYLSEALSLPVIEVSDDQLTLDQSLVLPKYTQPPISLVVNKPFIYFVRESITNSILLFGKLIDPTQMQQ